MPGGGEPSSETYRSSAHRRCPERLVGQCAHETLRAPLSDSTRSHCSLHPPIHPSNQFISPVQSSPAEFIIVSAKGGFPTCGRRKASSYTRGGVRCCMYVKHVSYRCHDAKKLKYYFVEGDFQRLEGGRRHFTRGKGGIVVCIISTNVEPL